MSTNHSNKKPVVVYGASGYTGRLVCEYLREYGIPFIAAGRSRAAMLNLDARASPFSASVLKFYRFIPNPIFLLFIDSLPCRCEKVKDCGTTTGHVGLDARTLMKDARGGLIR